MLNFQTFESFGSLNSKIALTALNNAGVRLMLKRMIPPGLSFKQKMDLFGEQMQANKDKQSYEHAWLCALAHEKGSKLVPIETTDPAPEERQCGYCLSTRGFDGWNCISCGAC